MTPFVGAFFFRPPYSHRNASIGSTRAPAPRPPPAHYDTSPHHRNSDALAELQLPPRVTQPMERVHRAPSTLFLVFSRKPRPLRTEGPHPPLSPRSSSLLTSPLLRADLRVSAPPRQDHTLALSHSLPPRVRPWH